MESFSTIDYKGILEGTNTLNKLNLTTINLLLENSIIEKEENFYLSRKNSTDFCFPLEYNSQLYKLNDKLLFEIYEILRFHMETVLGDSWNDGLDEIIFKMESFLTVNEKVDFLRKCYSDNFPKDKWFSVYSKEFFPEGEVNGVKSWKEWVYLNINDSPNLLGLYLGCSHEYFMKVVLDSRNQLEEMGDGLVPLFDLLKDWAFFFKKENILLFIKSKIEELEKVTDKNYIAYFKGKTIKHFLNEDLFNSLKKQLEIDGLIDEQFKLIHPGDNGWSELRAAACIGWLLKENSFLTLSQKKLVVVLSETFEVELSESTYSASKKAFKTNFIGDEPHLNNYSFINNL